MLKAAAVPQRLRGLPLDGEVELVVAVRPATDLDGTPAFAMALVQGGQVLSRRDGPIAVTGLDAKAVAKISPCGEWRVSALSEDLGTAKGVHVSAACRFGEDYYTGTEFAVIYRLSTLAPRDLSALERIWAGEAAYEHSEMDSCVTSRQIH